MVERGLSEPHPCEQRAAPMVTSRSGADVSQIAAGERDMALTLHEPKWGQGLKAPWQLRSRPGRHFWRDVTVDGRRLRDHLIRFPSAPIYGINRRQTYEVEFERPNLHTFRLLKRPTDHGEGVQRLFVLHNGLNETESLRFYYQLADWLIDECAVQGHRAACLIAPFPGHLTHFPFSGPFAEMPLTRYLSDSGELFRQFLRYMVEMKWLLSIATRTAVEPWMAGRSPLDPGHLTSELHAEWSALREASLTALSNGGGEGDAPASVERRKAPVGCEVDETMVAETVAVMEALLWGTGGAAGAESMPLHVVGYSLGGFLAQSMFFAWPNLVTSCATVCSGGAIRALSPTAFAHAEEWQAVLHSLRPEIEGSMLARKIARRNGKIVGMDFEEFGYLQRIFEQVFLQEDQASYKERVSEYGPRMMFVSGGEDPIVKTKDVLDASPAEGITMLSVARMTHFLGQDARTLAESEQRDFWLPEAGRILARSAIHAETVKRTEYGRALALREQAADRSSVRTSASPRRRPRQSDLFSPDFEHALDWVIDQVRPDSGWLFVCRNGIPAAFQSPGMQAILGGSLHHHDVQIQEYAAGLARRSRLLQARRSRLTICLSDRLETEFTGSHETFDAHSDTPAGLITAAERQAEWEAFLASPWRRRVRWFHAGAVTEPLEPELARSNLAPRVARWKGIATGDLTVTRIPDVWISLGQEVGLTRSAGDGGIAVARDFIDRVSKIVAEQQSDAARGRTNKLSKELERHLESGAIRIVRVSGAELNPRYRGRHEHTFARALLLLTHCAAALMRSTPLGPTPRSGSADVRGGPTARA